MCSCFIEFIKQVAKKCLAFYHFCNKFNKFNNTSAQMLESIHHMTLELIKITFLA